MLGNRQQREDRGASAIIIAFAMVLVMGIAAIAVDLGAGFNERRQDQTSADLAALSGGLSFGSQTAMVNQALGVARANLDTQYTDAEWQALWEGCADSQNHGFIPLPSPWTAGLDLPCISLSPSFFRVRVPEQIVETTFGKVIGFDSLTTDAYAVVTAWPAHGEGALPFGVEQGSPAGEACLNTGPAGTLLPPCDNPSSGSFGNIAPPQFGNTFQGTLPDCDNQTSANNYVPSSLAMGIDHILWKYPSASWTATGWASSDNTGSATVLTSSVNMDLCYEVTDSDGILHAVPADGVLIDGVLIDTGNNVKTDVTEGLISPNSFSDGKAGRLWRSSNTIPVRSGGSTYNLDNTPLWSHLLPSGTTTASGVVSYSGPSYAPSSCDPSNFTSSMTLDDLNDQIRTCIVEYDAGGYGGQIFGDTIFSNNPRFGVAPQLWHDNLGTGLAYRPIQGFRFVYIAGVWFDLQAVSDHHPFYPGDPAITEWCPVIQGSQCARIDEVEQMTVFLLVDNMVSEAARGLYPGDLNSIELSIYE